MSDLTNAGVIWKPPPLWPQHPLAQMPGQPPSLGASGGLQTTAGTQPGATGTTPPPVNQVYANNPGFIQQQPLPGSGPNAGIPQNIINSMGTYQDASYNNQTQHLDPYWQQQQNAFDQRMVSQGIAPGSQAYNNAKFAFDQGKNDAYSGAYNNSFQTGLAAQNQGYTQQYQYDALANALKIAQEQAGAQLGAAGIGANASMYNNDANNSTNQLLGLGNLGIAQGNQQMQGNQNDMQNLMALLGFGNNVNQQNNQLIGGAQNTLLGLIPNSNPAPIDVNGAYNINQQGVNSQYQGQVANSNGQNAMIGTALSALAIFL